MSNVNDAKDTRDSNATIGHLSCSNLAAQFSEQMAIAAIPILAVLALGASAQESATLQAINTLPFLLLSIPAGLLADRYRRKQLMIATELIRAAALFLLFVLFSAQTLGLYGLAALGFAIATGTVVYSVAAPALVAALIDKDDLLTANRRLEISRSIAFSAGPAVGGVLAGWASGMYTFLAAFTLSLASVWYLARLPAEARHSVSRRKLLQELFDGVGFIVANRYLRSIVATSFVYNTSWYLLLGIFAYYAISHLQFSASAVGAALGVYGSGMVAGGSGTTIRFALAQCSLGAILVACSQRGICAIALGDDPDRLARALQDQFPKAELIGGDAEFERLVAQVVGVVEAPAHGLDLPLDVRGTAFQQRVWQTLREIPPGTTATYTEIAGRIGAPKVVRAVVQACAANPIAVAIPCHRVVRRDGDLAGYRWGVERKRELLRREATTAC